MDSEDFESEELVIAEAIGLAFHGLDLVVGPFQRSGGEGVVAPGEDAQDMGAEGLGEVDEGRPKNNFPIWQSY